MQKDLIAVFSETEDRILYVAPKEYAKTLYALWGVSGDAELKPLEELIDNDAPLKEQIDALFDRMRLVYEHYAYEDKYIVEIKCGSWKRDHSFVNYLMKTVFGMSCLQEKTIGEEWSDDCWSAVHYYSLKDESKADENKITIYTEAKKYSDDLKYWSSATADCYDCLTGECLSKDELPKELQPLYDYQVSP